MALSTLVVGRYPALGTQVDAGQTYTNGVYTPGSTTYVAGYMDNENRAKFYYTDGVAISLPTLAKITQVSIVDAAGTTKTGSFYMFLTWPAASAGSPDLSSNNSQIYLDGSAILITASTAFG